MIFKSNKGFTLLEVMIASLILFASIAVSTLIYRAAYSSSIKSEQHIMIAGVIPMILDSVQNDLRTLALSGEDMYSGSGYSLSCKYNWEAKLIKVKSAPEHFDSSLEQFVVPKARFRLWDVQLVVSKKNSQQTFNYREWSWDAL